MTIDDSIQSHLVTSSSWSLSYYSSGVQKPQLDKFQEQADELGCVAHFQSILDGAIVNTSEKRAVRHHACRAPQHSFYQSQLVEIESLIEWQQSGSFSFDHIVYVGIGGSFLGPKLLDHSARLMGLSSKISVSFISSIDPHEVYSILNSFTVSRTLFIVVSKSGSTRETLDNIEMIRSYLVQNGHSEASHRNQFMAITTQGSQLDDEDLFVKRLYIDEAVGGRFSISSVVGMALLALSFGVSAAHEFLEGANEMDQSALNSNITENLSLFTALLNRYYRESCGYSARAVVPYCSALTYLPDYLQQLICESLGKPSDTLSGPLVTGGIGPNIQHSLFQHFHDSSESVQFNLSLLSVRPLQSINRIKRY